MTITTLATVPAVIALVTVAKDLGLPKKLSPLLAMLLGVGFTALDALATGGADINWFQVASTGVLLGLSASGFYDGAQAVGEGFEKRKREPKHLAK